MTDTRSVEEVIARAIQERLHHKELGFEIAAAILAALKDEGMVVVPVEPTTRMMIEMNEPYVPDDWDKYCRRYRAMISAAEECPSSSS